MDKITILNLLQLKIKNSGLRITESRKNIIKILSKANKDLTAEEIFVIALKKDPKIGIATVYRTLSLMEKFKFIEKKQIGTSKAVYRLTAKEDLIEKSAANQSYNKVLENNAVKAETQENLYPDSIDNTGISYYEKTENHQSIEKINKIQAQLSKWTVELNKIKREREINLEEIINDFSKVDKILEKHELSRNNLIQILIDFQTEYNWLPKHVLFYAASKIEVPLSQIYSIASFYKFFNLEPRGKYQITVCAGTACHVRGSMNLLQRIVNVLKIKPGDTTSDYKFTLDTVNCLGCCALGPVMLFNSKYYSNPSTKELEKLFGAVT